MDIFLVWLFSMFSIWVILVGRGAFTKGGLVERRKRRTGYWFLEV